MTKKVITKLWGVNPVPVLTAPSMDETSTWGSFTTTGINSVVVTFLWFSKES
ncbi:MAG: hypothetical protein JW984_00070 [Deltaproteobacteria bacterium]|uniref:Uncharacterized protein n=1 Tax=Candidatus Zymogenus saltonus TaxID=2844893 RepID=A0A9D8KC90_9DELT|nr:hypothetical protein [Candidatus Zymogenus saltonus]